MHTSASATLGMSGKRHAKYTKTSAPRGAFIERPAMTDNTKDALRKSLKNAIFAIPDEQLVSRDIIIHAIDAALSKTPVADAELTRWLHEFVRMYQGTLLNYFCDGRPVGKWIVERVMAKTESPSAVAAQTPVAVDKIDLVCRNLNEACWAFVEAMPHELPGPIFNDLKPAVKVAIEKYLALTLPAKSAEEVRREVRKGILLEPCDCAPEKRRNCDYCAGYGIAVIRSLSQTKEQGNG